MAGTFRIGGKVLATHNSETDEISLDSATNTSNMSFDANHAGIKTALNASGDAPIYACRAWVNFNGTLDENQLSLTTGENVYIRDSGNVSSVYYNGTGDYTVNFATAMPDANYAVGGAARYGDNSNAGAMRVVSICSVGTLANAMTTTSVRLSVQYANGFNEDPQVVNAVIFR